MPALTAAWELFRDGLAEPFRLAGGTVPDDPFHPFAAMLDDPDVRERLADLRAAADAIPAAPGDSHPALAVRLARLARLPAAGADPVEVPGLSDVDGRRLRSVPRAGRGRRQPWRVWAGDLAAYRAAGSAGPLRTATLA